MGKSFAVGVYSIMRYVASAIPYNHSFAVNPVGNGVLDIPLNKSVTKSHLNVPKEQFMMLRINSCV